MKIQTKAAAVLERTSHYLKAGVLREKPAWFDVVGSHPPLTDLTKKPKLFETSAQKEDPSSSLFEKISHNGTYKTRADRYDKKQKNNSVSRVPKLQFLEDQLRDVFYHQHPWEFSRPKTLIENDALEYSKCDWSHMLQFYKPLDGESVVQRTLWLLKDSKVSGKDMSLFEAYDFARFEFYRHRMEEEIGSAVAREESTMYGAIYPSTYMDWGLKQEQKHIDAWTKTAGEKTRIKHANRDGRAARASMGSDDVSDSTQSLWETTFDISDVPQDPEVENSKQ
ncbi:uncharacterized protein PRCAT00004804001 [Priceomyces carsonii]|uniref:uncharacterized protein n=1 Tax=Priceomyces carsonii TaxID=28549 RepID=UPI002EDAD457|nr:unnamed protein product [Priceomyces carsonii]